MSAEVFFVALNDIHDRYIEEAALYSAPVRRVIRPILRGLAAACLALIIGFSAVMVVSVEAREIVFGWIREQVNEFSYYSYEEPPANLETEPAEEPEDAIYEMTLIPEGYTLINHSSTPGNTTYIYADTQNHMLSFIYRDSDGNKPGFVTKDATMYTEQVRGIEADIYMANDPSAVGNAIIWEENDILFSISGFFDMETLIELAESVAVPPKEYALGYIPEGYTLYNHFSTPGFTNIAYVNAEGHLLTFNYTESEGMLVIRETAYATMYTSTVHGCEADIYIANDPSEEGNTIVWVKNDILFSISGYFDMETLIELAESVAVPPKEYALGYIPEGFTLMLYDPYPDETLYAYANYDTGKLLSFSYTRGSDNWLTVVDPKNGTRHTVTVRGTEADLYLPDDPDTESACLVWFEDDCMMIIQGHFTQEEVIQLAESVTEVPYSPGTPGE